MKPMLGGKSPYGDESRLAQIRYWQNIGGYGISPEILTLTGFWSDTVLQSLQEKSIDTSQTIQSIYGGVLRFHPLPGKKWEDRYDKVIDALNMILQVKRHIDHVLNTIPEILKEKWHDDDENYLPEDLPQEQKNKIIRKSSYTFAEDPYIAKQIMTAIPILKDFKNNVQYWSGIYREANSIFSRMVLEGVSMSLSNLSLKDGYNNSTTVTLEDLADTASEAIIEG